MASLRLVIGGGGTGGHTIPAIAVLEALRMTTSLEVLWIGSRAGLERTVAERAGVSYRWVPTGKLRREFTPRTTIDLIAIPLGILAATYVVRRFRPHVVFGTGGYVSLPAVLAAWLNRVPIVIHEQTAVPGLATRFAARFADVIAISYEASRSHFGQLKGRIVHTGLPVRRELLDGDPSAARRRFALPEGLPVIYVTGGALGAHAINEALGEALPALLELACVVHQCGRKEFNGDYPRLLARRATLPEHLQRRYVVLETVTDELPDLLAAAELVISRAGASTIAELALLGKPAILIPLPGTRGDEQSVNARLLAKTGSAIVLPQSELRPETLVELVRQLLADRETLRNRGQCGRTLAVPDAAERLARLILAVATRSPAASVSPAQPSG